MRRTGLRGLAYGMALLAALEAWGQQPRFTNAQLSLRPAGGSLEREFRALVNAQSAPAWIGYAAPVVGDRHRIGCSCCDRCCCACGLEGAGASAEAFHCQAPATTGPVPLESPGHFFVLFRVEQKTVTRIRTFSQDCELDAGGLPVFWLTGISPAESIALLAPFATSTDPSAAGEDDRRGKGGRISEGAMSAIALHADPAADRTLEQFVAASQPELLRKRAAFWLGAARGRRGYDLLRRVAREDPSEGVRERAVFALSISKEPEAVEAMIQAARHDASAHVRGQALFWLAHKAGKKAAEAITESIANDPENEVKRRAVFALSQLPKDQGVPLLIQVARTNRNPVVRKQAMFWLGQSRDPRALSFFEEILTKNN